MEPLPTTSLDRLVELHVLSEHGDAMAAAEAARLISVDAEARRVWDNVEATCQRLRGEAPAAATEEA
jgi:hypothetical protein